MRKLCIIAAAAILLAACEDYDPLPEPELPVIYIEFSGAEYIPPAAPDPENPGSNPISDGSIKLTFARTLSELGGTSYVYRYYNMEQYFFMGAYLQNKDINVISTRVNDGTIIFSFTKKDTLPAKLIFKTGEPMYFGAYAISPGDKNIIIAKGFIASAEISVNNLP
ncbi:MAG: hypothetical protein FWF29_03810 [Treponema sp.]|nr:hypothetical protein [Treponema sp.]